MRKAVVGRGVNIAAVARRRDVAASLNCSRVREDVVEVGGWGRVATDEPPVK